MRAGTAVVIGLVVFVMALAGWEFYWRAWGSEPAIRNSPGLWAMQRRRIDNGEGHKTVIVGSSRMLFDVQLPVWEQVGGERPIQLAIEGTSPLPVMEQLADDPDFTGPTGHRRRARPVLHRLHLPFRQVRAVPEGDAIRACRAAVVDDVARAVAGATTTKTSR